LHPNHPTADAAELLRGVPFFSQLGAKSIQRLAEAAVLRTYPAGTVLLTEGSTGLGLFILTAGRVRVFRGEPKGGLTLAMIGAGDILGEMALLDDQPRSASAITVTETDCLLISRESFQEVLREDSEIFETLVPALVARLRELQQRIAEVHFPPPATKGKAGVVKKRERPRRRPAVRAKEEKEEEEEEARAGATLRLLRLQHAVTLASIRGVAESVEVLGTFVRTLSHETGIAERQTARDIVGKLPQGLASATRAALKRSEKVPERMLASFRRNRILKQGSSSRPAE
jgi:CRP/FNR family cyclic AMP-dependent transcriptional regulator